MADADEKNVTTPGERDAAAVGVHPQWNLDAIVSELRLSREVVHRIGRPGPIRRTPSREALIAIMNGLPAALFPVESGCDAVVVGWIYLLPPLSSGGALVVQS
jgi:hypothetical protein